MHREGAGGDHPGVPGALSPQQYGTIHGMHPKNHWATKWQIIFSHFKNNDPVTGSTDLYCSRDKEGGLREAPGQSCESQHRHATAFVCFPEEQRYDTSLLLGSQRPT